MIEHIVGGLVLGCLILHSGGYLRYFAHASLFLNSLFAILSMKDACRASTLHRILTGEVSALLLYLGFLLADHESTLLYYLPVLTSCAGKLYIMLQQRTNLNLELV